MGDWLQKGLLGGTILWVVMNNPFGMAVNIFTYEWDLFAQVIAKMPERVRAQCAHVAEIHMLHHSSDGKLSMFWEAMHYNFL